MTTFRIRLRKNGRVEKVSGTSYTIEPNNLLSIYKDDKPIAEYSPKGWVWIKPGPGHS